MDIFIDGIGRLSLPLKLKAHRRAWEELSDEEQLAVMPTQDPKLVTDSGAPGKTMVWFIEEDRKLAVKVEQWALEYTSKFVHAAGPAFYATTMAQILGTAYVKKKLPEVRLPMAAFSHQRDSSIRNSPPSSRPIPVDPSQQKHNSK